MTAAVGHRDPSREVKVTAIRTRDLVGPSAEERLRAAHASVYRWPSGFTGFTADLTVDGAGEVLAGRLTVAPGGEHEVTFDVEETSLAEWAREELGMMVVHRTPLRFEDADGRFALRCEGDDGAGHRIHVDDPLASSYLIDEAGRILEISRSPGTTRFTICILDAVPAPGGTWLSRVFSVSYWDAGRGLDRVQVFRDEYAMGRDAMLPASRRVITAHDAGVETRSIALHGHRPAEETA
jgi:hypothetical protein